MYNKRIFLGLLVGLSTIVLGACAGTPPVVPTATPVEQPTKSAPVEQPTKTPEEPAAGMPNPASVYCEEQGGTLQIRTDAQGGQYGVCVFEDGSECDEWAFFRGECKPGTEQEQPESTPVLVEVPAPPSDWQIYVNDDAGYRFYYPPAATITEQGVEGFPTDELPEGMSTDDYVAQLEQQYGNKLCVSVGYELGYVNISAPANQGFRYTICGRTGVGVGEMLKKSETIVVAGQPYTATGFEFTGPEQPCEALSCHNETFVLQLADGTRIEYGAAPADNATYADYLATTRDILLQIVASYTPNQ